MSCPSGKFPRASQTELPCGRIVRQCAAPAVLGCVAVWLAVFPVLMRAETEAHDDRLVKVAFVYNLTKYVEWPEPSSEIVIGFVGDDATGEIIRTMLNGKTSDSRTIRIVVSPSDEELERCNVLYMAGVTSDKVRKVLSHVPRKGVLTVGDAEFFIRDSGMIGLVTIEDHVQIQVNLPLARDAGLKISSRLLSIAVLAQPGSGRD